MNRYINRIFFINNSSVIALLIVVFTITSLNYSCGDDVTRNIGPDIPVALEAGEISTTSFLASWERVFKGESYELDISDNASFTQFVEGYQAKNISALQEEVTGLRSNTDYYFRVRGVVDGTPTENSNTISLKTRLIPNSEATLKGSATDFFVGVAVSPSRVQDSDYVEVYKREFNSITAENAMKMRSVFIGIDGEGNNLYNWEDADAIVNFAENNGMNLHGHALIWHRSVPDFVRDFTGTDEEFEQMIRNYIMAYVSRYKGRVDSWDVVNEAINDGDGSFRSSIFSQRMGDDYVKKCFDYARQADGEAILFYNDYSMVIDNTKRSAVMNLVDNLNAGNLIDGVGYQMHITYNNPSKEQIQSAMQEIVSRNLVVHFSELDVRVNPSGDITSLTEERAIAQQDKVRDVVEVYNGLPAANKYALSIWGLKDDYSWIPGEFGNPDWPLLFDARFNKKEAYTGFLEGLE